MTVSLTIHPSWFVSSEAQTCVMCQEQVAAWTHHQCPPGTPSVTTTTALRFVRYVPSWTVEDEKLRRLNPQPPMEDFD